MVDIVNRLDGLDCKLRGEFRVGVDLHTVKDAKAEIERLRKIESAAVVVINGLNERIITAHRAYEPAPVFKGISQLHNALFGRSASRKDADG